MNAEHVERLVTQVLEETRGLRQEMKERFDQVDERFDQVDERFAGVDERFVGVEERLASIDRQFAEVRRDIRLVQTAVLETSQDVKTLKQEMTKVDTVLSDHEARLRKLEGAAE